MTDGWSETGLPAVHPGSAELRAGMLARRAGLDERSTRVLLKLAGREARVATPGRGRRRARALLALALALALALCAVVIRRRGKEQSFSGGCRWRRWQLSAQAGGWQARPASGSHSRPGLPAPSLAATHQSASPTHPPKLHMHIPSCLAGDPTDFFGLIFFFSVFLELERHCARKSEQQ